MAQPRVEDAFVSVAEVAKQLDIHPTKVRALLKEHGIEPQTLTFGEREVTVWDNPGTIRTAFVGTATAAELLDTPKANVVKTLRNQGLQPQTIKMGKRPMSVYPRLAVMEIQKNRRRRPAKDPSDNGN